MGFSLKHFFEELQELIAADMKPKKKLSAIQRLVAEAKQYADDCGKLEH